MSVTYGGEILDIVESITPSQIPHRTKQSLGKRVTMHEIIGADSLDWVLDIRGRLTNTTVAGLKTDVANLAALQDGTKHAYADTSDSTYDGDYVIETGSLTFERQINPLNIIISLRLVQW